MLTTSLYISSAEHSLAGGYSVGYSPIAKQLPSPLFGQLRQPFSRPYDYTLFPAYFSPRPYEEINPTKVNFFATSPPSPLHYYSGVLPRTPPLTQSSSIATPLNSSVSPFYASVGTIGEYYGRTPAGDSQRTTSVIMKVEHQKVVELNAKDFHGRSSSESEDEIIICKWKNCYRNFDTLDQLATHVTQSHATASSAGFYFCQWEKCPRSERGFNARYKMLVHVRTHTKEKPHQCTECFKSFSRAENLKIHIRSHSGEKPYVCPVDGCNKAYSNSSDRFKHTRTHSTEKPYFCKFPSCNKRYTDPSSLRKHVKTFKHTSIPISGSTEPEQSESCAQDKPLQSSPTFDHQTTPNGYRKSVDVCKDTIDDVQYSASREPHHPAPLFYTAEIRCDCSPHCPQTYIPGGELYHLFNHSVSICSPRITRDDESGTDYWIEEKIDRKNYMDVDVPLDLSVHKSVR